MSTASGAARPRVVLTNRLADHTNPWLSLWVQASERGGTELRQLDRAALTAPRRALPAGVHLQWPEHVVNGPSHAAAAARTARLLGQVSLARLRRVPVLLTVHNLSSHHGERPRLERLLWAALTRLVTDVHVFAAASRPVVEDAHPALRRRRWHVIPHGDYASVVGHVPSKAAARAALALPADCGVVLLFGALKRYKGVEEALSAACEAPGSGGPLLVVVGAPGDSETTALLEAAADRSGRVRLDLRYLPQHDLTQWVAASDLVLLPYRRVLSSGSAVLALTCGRPVLVPEHPTFREMQQVVGEQWVTTYAGPLTAQVLQDSLRRTQRLSSVPSLDTWRWEALVTSIEEMWDTVTGGRG